MRALELIVEQWLNSGPLSLADLRGRVVALHFFQMLCPGCIVHGLPQTQRLFNLLRGNEMVQIIAVHSVFEHHEVMTLEALQAFVYEFRYSFPIAVDRPGIDSPLPQTMQAYGVRGTPSWVLINPHGEIVANLFGQVSDLELGLLLGQLLQMSD